MKLPKTTTLLIALLALAFFGFEARQATAQGIENGDFSMPGDPPDPFDAWTTFPIFTAPTDDGGAARLATVDFLDDIQLEQTFLLPTDAILLSFELEFLSGPGGTNEPSTANDSFQVSLFDEFFFPINSIDPFLPAYYSIDSSGFQDLAPGVSVEILGTNLRRISLDLSSIPSQQATLEFLMLGDNDGMTTAARIDNVLLVVPEPSTPFALATLGLGMLRRRRTC